MALIGVRSTFRLSTAVLAVALNAQDGSVYSQTSQNQRMFCGAPVQNMPAAELRPRDDASQRPDFLAFRTELLKIVAARDVNALLRIVDPAIRVSFGGASGIEDFKTSQLNSTEVDFWQEFDFILRHGGRLRTVDAFDAPYSFSDWPSEFDAFECLAVTGSRVRLRAGPSLTAPIVTLISYAIVERLDSEPASDWWRVLLADGRSGYMASRYLRSPVDHRALFEFKNGRWMLVAYIAGD